MSSRTLVFRIFKASETNIPTWRIIAIAPPDDLQNKSPPHDCQIKNVTTQTKGQKAIPNLRERINHLKKVFTVNAKKKPAKPKTLSTKKGEIQNRILKNLRKFKNRKNNTISTLSIHSSDISSLYI